MIQHTLQCFSNCNTTNVVYAIWCPCGLLYIGQTSQSIKLRIGQHRSRIRCGTEGAPLVAHYMELNHTPDQIFWQVIEVIKLPVRGGHLPSLLFRAECKWITRCRSIDHGLNTTEEWSSYLTQPS